MSQPAADSPILSIFALRDRDQVRVTLAGDLDVTSADCLLAWAAQLAVQPLTGVRLDVSGLRFVDVGGLRALVGACGLLRQRCGPVELAGIPPSLSRLADLTCTELLARPPDC
jgi:anti-anti-sigma factor